MDFILTDGRPQQNFANSKQKCIFGNNNGKYYTLPVERCLLLTQQHKGWEIYQRNTKKRLRYKKQLRGFAKLWQTGNWRKAAIVQIVDTLLVELNTQCLFNGK